MTRALKEARYQYILIKSGDAMAIKENPNMVLSRNLRTGPTPIELFDTAVEVSKNKTIFPATATGTVNFNGEIQLTGPLNGATRSEIASLSADTIFQVLQIQVHAGTGQPRVIITYQPGMGHFLLQTQGISQEARSEAKRVFLSLEAKYQRTEESKGVKPRAVPSSVPISLKKGTTIDSYQLVKRLGRGYSAEVWEAQVTHPPVGVDLNADDRIALKLYTRIIGAATDTLRIQREFHIATEARHSNLVRVYDLVLSPSRPFHNFLAMELVRGRTLKSAIPRRGMKTERIISISKQVASALQALHSRAALHRDVKAANIMITKSENGAEVAKLCDLGIVSVLGDPSLTGTMFLGSKHAAPLEQLTGDDLDFRTDVYSLGSVMFHCYVGRAMYHGAGPEGAIVRRMLEGNPESVAPRTENKQDVALADLINELIAVDPAQRPADAAGVLSRLSKIENS